MADYKKAIRQNLVFEYSQGWLNLHDLWEVSISNLRSIAKDIHSQIKDYESEDSLLLDLEIDETDLKVSQTKEQKTLTLKFEIVKDVLKTRIEEQKNKLNEKEKAQKKQVLLEHLHQKQNEELAAKSPEELKAMIADLG